MSTTTAAATAAPVKPALKHSDNHDHDELDSAADANHNGSKHDNKKKSSRRSAKGKDRHLKWDEAKIQEHDQLRGTRMKIEEPNTPYHHPYDSGSETDGSLSSAKRAGGGGEQISWDALSNKLEAHAAVKEAYPSSPSSHGGDNDGTMNDDDDEERQKELKRLEFKEHRKRHYNEMELVRKFRQEHPDEDEEEDDEENDADDENE
mmetsp:Transcript_2604/g.4953  ORF Transcript_2604/g.4953 Transcript_2604/m.4953 type:complete len:205 (-) Transcript_2604:193-807(-)|eukprot:CAMPEP_0178784334 /NCGR_PEP_ID=MMETSP0745-20121128/4183_1 /TAXON_ID=913974 /ORGANISM="Nitzschia punctata, Strain CCMP561" /LENGTH=204 /DNA_ID=CAMNT_0020441945 /DNA_START=17 /DNA_END=631 /DNA_ORIENTATION=+